MFAPCFHFRLLESYEVLQQQQQQQQQWQEEEKEEEEEEQKQEQTQAKQMWQKMCGKMVTSCGMKRTPHCAPHLRARAEHMNNTNAHTTIHNPYGIPGVRSSTIWKITLFLDIF